jgi:tryptophan synthase alpha chain
VAKIENIFTKRKSAGQKTNIVYITPEYPFDGLTIPLCKMLSENNVHIIEIGVPFSDPLADGPTIQKSSYEALKKNITISRIFDLVKEVRQYTDVAIVLMTYINPVLSYGIKQFISDCKQNGVDGIIVPDLPLDEIMLVKSEFDNTDIDLVMLAAPTTPSERLENIASNSRGFIYCVSVTGVTGIRDNNYIDRETIAFLERIRSCSKVPIAVGFGLSSSEQLKELAPYTDGYIIGSALIKSMEQAKGKDEAIKKAKDFIRQVYSN